MDSSKKAKSPQAPGRQAAEGSHERKSDRQASQPSLQRPATRAARLSTIERILMDHIIGSQSQLSDLLDDEGFAVTQATLSRDLDEIHAVKTRLKDGSIAYRLADDPQSDLGEDLSSKRVEQQMGKVLTGLLVSAAAARNLVVIHTPAGAAQYVASVIDRQPLEGILGTIAGDDTVMMICVDDGQAQVRAQWLLDIASKGQSS
ncbi:arginine repressor [Bifidobacterium aemilianum]|uniref:Arginine repressor n=1 Tax=Bifidobacterium aemilianum TaxID=2493120 RepID=A0A366K9U6_9BIFI|nr:arginine repressor [Bifidobacterium aemilianum]RBP98369.1 arginine repressor [Bifidobacterium aemilianum]